MIENISKCDGIGYRAFIAGREIATAGDETKGSSSEIALRRKLLSLEREIGYSNLINEMARKDKKFDILTALAMSEPYEYLLEKKDGVTLWDYYNDPKIIATGGKEKDFITSKSLLHSKLMHMSEQFFPTKVKTSSIDSEQSLTDKEGKSSNLLATVKAEEVEVKLVPDRDSDIMMNFEVYLEFLYSASTALKPTASTSATLLIPDTLLYLWFKDTISFYTNNQGNYKYFNIYDTGKNTKPTMDRVNSNYLLKVTKKDISRVILDSNYKTLLRFKNELGDSYIDIGTNVYVFARYIYRLLQLAGIDIFKEIQEEIGEDNIYDLQRVKQLLIERIPMYKFEPKFFRKVRTFEEWVKLSKEELEEEYGLATYKNFDGPPAKQLGNSSFIPPTSYDKPTVQEKREELKNILILEHLSKCSISHNPNKLFKSIFFSAKERAYIKEGPISISRINEDFSISLEYEAIKEKEMINKVEGHSMFRVEGLKIDATKIRNIDPRQPTEETEKFIKQALKEKYIKVATKYKEYYDKHNWVIPQRFMTTEDLARTLMETLITDRESRVMLILGDAVEIDIYVSLSGQKPFISKVYLREDYKVIFNDQIVLTPDLEIIDGETRLVVRV